jgi:hypothetical protein
MSARQGRRCAAGRHGRGRWFEATEVAERDPHLQELLFLGLYQRGAYRAARGMISLSLPTTGDQLSAALAALDGCLGELSSGGAQRHRMG